MPQADEELRAEWSHGEEGGGDEAAMAHLRAAGFTLTCQWTWTPPPGHTVTDRDRSAVLYLIDEWDFGGFTPRS
jgi:hypothetical protein